MIVAMDFSSKSQKLNANKRMNRQILKCKRTESLLSNKKTEKPKERTGLAEN